MIKSVISSRHRPTLVAMAVFAACAATQAQAESDDAPLVEGTVSVGLGIIDGASADRAQFGQYNGLHNSRDFVGTLGMDYNLRDPENSKWVDFQAENLLSDTRELRLVWKNPGQWKFTADYSELVRSEPNTINTGMLGLGSTTPQVVLLAGGPATGQEFELKTKRSGMGIGFSKQINSAVQFDVNLKSENKEGSRLFGIGMNCPSPIAACSGTTGISTGWALLMLPEPINSNHSQIEARVSYSQEKLRLSAGYYGSFYQNSNSTLNPVVPGSLNNPLGSPLALSAGLQSLLSQPIALAPDNHAQQLDVTGNYAFTDKTQGTFKLAYTTASQTDNFANAGLTAAPAGVTSLGGKVNTTLARLGVTSRPIPKLSLLADWRYENKDDQTPIASYNFVNATTSFTNRNLSDQKNNGKVQASWQFNEEYRGTLGVDYESIDRDLFTATSAVAGISALRQKTEEVGLRAELRRRLTENFSGSITLSSSQRDGSNWLRNNSGAGVTEVVDPSTGFLNSAIFMPSLADRQRDKVRMFADWQPTEKLALQFSAEEGRDKYNTPTVYGLRNTRMNQFGIDWGYALSFNWNFNGYLSRGLQTFNQSRYAGYVMAFENTSTNAGVGFTGKVSSQINVGGNLTFADDKSVYAQTLDTFAGADSAALLAGTGGLPETKYRQTALKLFGKYDLNKRSALRMDLIHQRNSVNDWAWGFNGVPFVYSDGTTVVQRHSQRVSFIGITYVYQLQ